MSQFSMFFVLMFVFSFAFPYLIFSISHFIGNHFIYFIHLFIFASMLCSTPGFWFLINTPASHYSLPCSCFILLGFFHPVSHLCMCLSLLDCFGFFLCARGYFKKYVFITYQLSKVRVNLHLCFQKQKTCQSPREYSL